jgi:hypothetical protein
MRLSPRGESGLILVGDRSASASYLCGNLHASWGYGIPRASPRYPPYAGRAERREELQQGCGERLEPKPRPSLLSGLTSQKSVRLHVRQERGSSDMRFGTFVLHRSSGDAIAGSKTMNLSLNFN